MNNTEELAKKIAQAVDALPRLVAEEAVEYSRTRFSGKAFNGVPWKPVSPRYHPHRGTLMVRSGKLLNSVRVARVTPRKVVIAAGNGKVPYAQVHNEGFFFFFVVKAHSRRVKGGKTVRVKSHDRQMRIPQRQFMGNCPELEKRLKEVSEQLFKTMVR